MVNACQPNPQYLVDKPVFVSIRPRAIVWHVVLGFLIKSPGMQHFQIIPDEVDFVQHAFNDTVVTSTAHQQRMSNLCGPFGVITLVRSELKQYIQMKVKQRCGGETEKYVQQMNKLKRLLTSLEFRMSIIQTTVVYFLRQ